METDIIAFYDPADNAAWRDKAECRDMPVDMFFLQPGQSRLAVQAYSVCRQCKVRQECLDMTMAAEGSNGKNDRYGISGGMSAYERALLHLNRRTGAEGRYAR